MLLMFNLLSRVTVNSPFSENKTECDPQSEIYCSEGRCLPAVGPLSVLCDHYADCLHGEDEEGCGMFTYYA